MQLGVLDVVPWVRYLSTEEACTFAVELVEALSDAAEVDLGSSIDEVIAGWRATARIKADPGSTKTPSGLPAGDFGPVDVRS